MKLLPRGYSYGSRCIVGFPQSFDSVRFSGELLIERLALAVYLQGVHLIDFRVTAVWLVFEVLFPGNEGKAAAAG